MLAVAHMMRSYLGQSETFIWQYLHMLKNVFPVILARSLENLDQFRLPRGKLYKIFGPRFSRPWFIDNWNRRLRNKQYGYIQRIMESEEIRLIHAHYGPVGCDYLSLASYLNVSLITNFYGFDLSVHDVIDQYKQLYLRLFQAGQLFLVEGPCMQKKLISLGCPAEKIRVQRIALDLEKYEIEKHKSDAQGPIKLLFVGRLVEKKGLAYALRALARLKKDFSFEFKIIGNGGIEESIRKLADDLGFKKEIIWLGMQPHTGVLQELQACDILIQPSVTAGNGDTEGGAPTIILEAQACGIPVIATHHADIPHITNENRSALLSPERDIEALSDNMRYLFSQPELWPEMGRCGRAYVEDFHDVRKEVIALEGIYENMLVSKQAA